MKRRHLFAAVLAAGVAASALLVPAANAGNVGFNVAIGGPGFGLNVGNFGWNAFVPGPFFVPRPVFRPAVVRVAPAPVWGAPGFGPAFIASPPIFAPPPVVFIPPVVAVRPPVFRPAFRPVFVIARPIRPGPRFNHGWNTPGWNTRW